MVYNYLWSMNNGIFFKWLWIDKNMKGIYVKVSPENHTLRELIFSNTFNSCELKSLVCGGASIF